MSKSYLILGLILSMGVQASEIRENSRLILGQTAEGRYQFTGFWCQGKPNTSKVDENQAVDGALTLQSLNQMIQSDKMDLSIEFFKSGTFRTKSVSTHIVDEAGKEQTCTYESVGDYYYGVSKLLGRDALIAVDRYAKSACTGSDTTAYEGLKLEISKMTIISLTDEDLVGHTQEEIDAYQICEGGNLMLSAKRVK